MLSGRNAKYSYAFYGVNSDFEIYDLLSGKVVDKFVSYKGHTDREDIIHNILSNGVTESQAKEIFSYSGIVYTKDIKIAKGAIKLLYKTKGKSIPATKQSKLKKPLIMFCMLYTLLLCLVAYTI